MKKFNYFKVRSHKKEKKKKRQLYITVDRQTKHILNEFELSQISIDKYFKKLGYILNILIICNCVLEYFKVGNSSVYDVLNYI